MCPDITTSGRFPGEGLRPGEYVARSLVTKAAELPPEQWWRFAAAAWALTDHMDYEAIAEVQRRFRGFWSPDCMLPKGRAVYDAMPPVVTLWRGQPSRYPLGLRWADDWKVAKRYANRPGCKLYVREVPKRDIALVSGGGEMLTEVILFERPA